jgi:hypothetical protein
MERRFYHNRYHNGRSLEVLREEIAQAHGGLAVHGGGERRGCTCRRSATPEAQHMLDEWEGDARRRLERAEGLPPERWGEVWGSEDEE